MKFPCESCKAECCVSPGLSFKEYSYYLEKLGPDMVREISFGPNSPKLRYIGTMGEKCPLLKDNRCSIYEDRPSVCRKFGEIPELKCPKVNYPNIGRWGHGK